MNLAGIWLLIVGAVNDAWNLDWNQLSYKRTSWVIGAATLIGAALLTTLVIRWRQKRKAASSYYYTSIKIDKRHRTGIVFRFIRGFNWGLVLIALYFLGVTLSEPVYFITNTTETIKSREIIYLYDASASNGFKATGMKISRGTLSREFMERLMAKRDKKRDRAAYVVFATQSEVWSGFTTSSDSLKFSVSRSPLALAPGDAPLMWPGDFILKKGQFVETDEDQGTNLHLGLESVIYLFDRKGSPKITAALKQNPNAKMRSVIITTDGASDKDPEIQFRELKKRHIIPYLIFVDPGREIEKRLYGDQHLKAQTPQQLLTMVRRYGGEYFLAKDRDSVDQISQMLDKLHGVDQVQTVNIKEKEIYFVPLALAFLFAIAAILMRVIFLRVWRTV